MDYVIETNALSKRYGKKLAVDKMSLHVRRGDIYGLIGKNGAGKTTLMKLLLGLTNPNGGEMRLFGSDDLNAARMKIGSLIEEPALFKNETAYENMKYFAILSGAPEEEIAGLLELVGLADTGSKKAGEFSLGMKQRLGIAIAMLGEPEIMILDEPINGLDPAGIKEIRDVILELSARGVTFLISSHLLDELGKIATNYGIMSDGVLVEEITSAELEEKCRTSVKLIVDDVERAVQIIKEKLGEPSLECTDHVIRILSDVGDTSVIAESLVGAGIRVYQLANESRGFEDFFIERAGR